MASSSSLHQSSSLFITPMDVRHTSHRTTCEDTLGTSHGWWVTAVGRPSSLVPDLTAARPEARARGVNPQRDLAAGTLQLLYRHLDSPRSSTFVRCMPVPLWRSADPHRSGRKNDHAGQPLPTQLFLFVNSCLDLGAYKRIALAPGREEPLPSTNKVLWSFPGKPSRQNAGAATGDAASGHGRTHPPA